MKKMLSRVLFLTFSTAIMVVFSEKIYWHPTGYALGELLIFYACPVFVCLWAVEYFRVRTMPALVFIAALFAFLVEGVLTPVIYEAGLLDPVMPAYFVGWHGLLSVVFGWYLVRKWLLTGQWERLLLGGAAFGVFWGLWATTFWLPESLMEFESLAAAGEPVIPGVWPISAFGLHALTFTGVLIAAHALLGSGGWPRDFSPGKVEKGLVLLGLLFFFFALVLPVFPLAVIKLAALLLLVYFGLRTNRTKSEPGSLLQDLQGRVRFSHTLTLLAMPFTATSMYALLSSFSPSEDMLRFFLEIIPGLQAFLGGGMFVWAMLALFRPQQEWAPEAVR